MDASQLAALEARLQRLEDLAEIHQLFIDYGRHLDRGDFAAYAALFAADGELDLGATGKAKGREAIRAAMEASMAPLVGSFVHVVSSPAVDLHGDTATSEVMWTAVRLGSNDKPQVTMVGRHLDDLVREGGRWLIGRRRGVLDLPSEHRGSGLAAISRSFGRVAEADSRDTGSQVCNTVDCLIAAVAIRIGSPLLHCDAGFATLARHTDLVTRPASLS